MSTGRPRPGGPAERRRTVAVSTDRGLRVSVRLPHRRARGRRTGRSTGSASRPSTHRASSAACSTDRPASSALRRSGSTIRPRGSYEPGTNVLLHDLEDAIGLGARSRDALTVGPWDHEDQITPHTRPPADDDADHMLVRTVECLEGQVEVEIVCEPAFDYGRARRRVDDGRRRPALRRRERGRADLSPGVRSRPRHRGRPRARPARPPGGEKAYCAISWAEGLAAPAELRGGRGADRSHDPLLARLAEHGRESPTTACAIRSSARRSRSRA